MWEKAVQSNEQYGEADILVDDIVRRYKKGLYSLVFTTGLPGTGKSYFDLRLKELQEARMLKEFGIEPQQIKMAVDSLLEFIKLIRVLKEGQVIVLEELSVLFPSKRAMSGDNVDVGKILDTVRKKKLILIANAPVFTHIDSHVRAMANFLVETKKIDRRRKITLTKVLRLQTNPRTGVTYFHTMIRHSTGKEVHYILTNKPSDNICIEYEKDKDTFLDKLYKKLEDKHQKKLDKEETDNKVEPSVMFNGSPTKQLTPTQEKVYKMTQEGLSGIAIAKILGIQPASAYSTIDFIRKKGYKVLKMSGRPNNLTLKEPSDTVIQTSYSEQPNKLL